MHPIRLRGARLHNLQGISIDLLPGELVAITGVSGSGKSSLAFDTLYAEGQRRFVESFSPYARQFLERLERPPMDGLEPIAAGIAVDRRAPIKSSRSTVATMADLEPYLCALFTREAVPMCPDCGVLAERTDPSAAAERALRDRPGARAVVSYSQRVEGTERYLELRERLLADGYRRVLVGNEARDLDELRPSEALVNGSVDVIVDRLRLGERDRSRLAAAIEEAWRRGEDSARLHFDDATVDSLRRGLTCPRCTRSFATPTPGLFSYQSPVGACPTCRGFGRVLGIDWAKVVPDESLTLGGGAIRPWNGKKTAWERKSLRKFCERSQIAMTRPWRELTRAQQRAVLDGEGSWYGGRYPGVKLWFEWLESKSYKMHVRVLLSRYRSYDPCRACGGKRLGAAALGYRVADLDLGDWHALELRDARARLDALRPTTGQGDLARQELRARLGYLERVGLGYLTLDRQARTLSGGEAQRVSLTAALGSSLTGALFVLDEPTVGLHPTDLPPLVEAMRELAHRGNCVAVVEHDASVIAAADRVLELGPGAGPSGGRLVFDGTPHAARRERGATARSLAAIELAPPRAIAGDRLVIRGASANNLGDIDVEIPLAALVVLCGPSGSGKSTLADGILHRAIARARGENDVDAPLAHRTIEGIDRVARVVLVDQSPLGRTSRGNAATYSGCWTRFRQLFAAEPHALLRDLGPSHFSFNVAAGRCEACAGEGAETVEMQFLADVRLTCPACQGKRFRSDVLEVRLDGRSVADVMSMSIGEVIAWIGEREPTIARALLPLDRLGLGYLTLGQPLSTLSGGEAQRLKLARAMAEASAGTLLILDEPSAGLHANEVGCVVAALRQLVADGASVVVVDHDAAIIAAADWAIELGPGAGIDGGRLVFAGSPIDLAGGSTRTGRALAAAHRAVPQNGAHVDASRAAPRRAPHESRADAITVLGAREHNLADVAVRIPRGKLVVVTGPSGSGKSSLAFDVVFAEGQRRFLETLTPYARQFLPTMPRPDVDQVHGLPPSVALEQRTARAGASSTVATVTEIAHYLRLLYAKVGVAHCPDCDLPVEPAAADTVLRRLQAMRGDRILLAPIVRARKGTHYDVFTLAEQAGIEIAWVDGEPVRTDKPPRLAKTKEHTIELVVHTGNMRAIDRAVVSRALELGRGHLVVTHGKGERTLFSTARACSGCGRAVPELDPRWFSFNTAQGRCESCEGTGLRGGVEAARAIVRGSVDDAVTPGALEPCPSCDGSRLAPIPRAVRLAGERYHQHLALSVTKMAERVAAFSFEGAARTIAKAPLAELARRLRFVERVGLGYLTLDRRAQTLSGGEMQRLRLAAQLGSGLTGALYVLDEPTIGLHPRDTGRLLDNLRTLRDTGSTVLVVEHDAETIKAADHLIDLGPGGGRRGGRIVAEGPPAVVLASDASPTARAFRNAMRDPTRMPIGGEAEAIVLRSVRANNLRVDRLAIPSKRMCVVAGVSGSGKSTLVSQVLFPAARRALGLTGGGHNPTATIVLPRDIARVIAVDQSPIGRTSRSVPATFLGVWDPLRKLFAATSEARARGFRPARFSFNSASAGGRCSACDGLGVIGHEMAFLPDVETTCQSCNGMRFEPTTLDARWQGLSIGEILRLTVEEAAALFRAHRAIARPLETLCDLGVGYVQLGQGSPTLSGGEAQRLKLAAELTASGRHRPTLYVLDEPTTGLHHSDVARLISVLDALVRRGDSLVIIEHHPSVIAAADWVIELGPEGGDAGGRVVAEGSPAAIALGNTATGQVLGQVVPPKVGTQRTHA